MGGKVDNGRREGGFEGWGRVREVDWIEAAWEVRGARVSGQMMGSGGGMGGEVGAQGGSGGMLKRAGNGDCCLILTMEDDSLASTSGESVLE